MLSASNPAEFKGDHKKIQMKKTALLFTGCVFILFIPVKTWAQARNASSEINFQLDGAKKFQQLDGFGVNVNTRSWNGEELVPALSLLHDSLNASIWRVIVETVYKWEDQNDNNDPFTFNWDYYNELYETPKFQKAWNMIRFMNEHGITDKLMINFMGPIPLWMGGTVVKPQYEDEYIEMLVSFFYYAIKTKHLKIGLISLMNEPDIHNEGPTVGSAQFVRLLRKLIDRMQSLGMDQVRYVAPDVAGMKSGVLDYIPALMNDSVVMSRIAHFGLHSYGGNPVSINTMDSLKKSPYPLSSYWMTEWNAWRDGLDDGLIGVYDYKFASDCVNYLIGHLQNGAKACLIWEGYDSYYEHHAPSTFSYWGILSYDQKNKIYSPRKHFYALQQFFKFILPGSWRIDCSTIEDSVKAVTFLDPVTGQITMAGVNNKTSSISLRAALSNLPAYDHFELFYTDSTQNLHKNPAVSVKGKSFRASIPPECIFTLIGHLNK
jgi:O-glycosyl hydrolase